MSNHQYRSPFGDTTFTKVFVGGLAWETPTDRMRRYFEPFGEILEAVIINDKYTGNSKGYGFVTFRDPESANRACHEPNPIIDGRRANCNIASFGRSRPSLPRGTQEINFSAYSYGGGMVEATTPVQPVFYPSYGYAAYPPEYGYHSDQSIYNIQQQQFYGTGMGVGPTYYYGHSSMQPGNSFAATDHHQAQRIPTPSYLYYPTQMDSFFTTYHHHPPPRSSPPSATATAIAAALKLQGTNLQLSPSQPAQQWNSNASETEIESDGNFITSES